MKDCKDTLYYDGQCPICSKEVGLLKNLSGDNLTFSDINQQHDLPIEAEQLATELHVQLANGTWLKGVDANLHIWSQTRFALFVRILKLPVFYQCTQLGYRIWLAWYQRHRKKRLARHTSPADR